MGLSLFETTLPVIDQTLLSVDALLRKAVRHTRSAGTSPDALLALRIAPDMLPLSVQIDILASAARGSAARLAGRLLPDNQDPAFAVFNRGDMAQFSLAPTSMEAAGEALAGARAYLAGVHEADMAAPDQPIHVSMGGFMRSFETHDFVLYYLLPNLHFHATIVYALLRGAGVALGKADFEGHPAYRLSAVRQPSPGTAR